MIHSNNFKFVIPTFVQSKFFSNSPMKLVFATNNKHKLSEIRQLLSHKFSILSLDDIGVEEDLPENQNTLEGNAHEKAMYVFEKYGENCFADDSGLEIEALGGRPGVYSARYAGKKRDAFDNMQKVLSEMKEAGNRNARFKTVISLIIDGKEKQFEGVVYGTILEELRGKDGFGYDPIFQPEGFNKSFAEMSAEEKNLVSHRGMAVRKLVEYLEQLKEEGAWHFKI
jgi:XTP/dITP diphosphohydrolase